MLFPELPNQWTEIIKQGRHIDTCMHEHTHALMQACRHMLWRHSFAVTGADMSWGASWVQTCQVKEDSPYLHRSPSLSGTHSLGGMCSCNSPGCFCIGHCHKAAYLPSTHQCLQTVSRKQEVDMVNSISGPPIFHFYCLSIFMPHYSKHTQHYSDSTFLHWWTLLRSFKALGKVRLNKGSFLFSFSYPPWPSKCVTVRFIFTFKALIKMCQKVELICQWTYLW